MKDQITLTLTADEKDILRARYISPEPVIHHLMVNRRLRRITFCSGAAEFIMDNLEEYANRDTRVGGFATYKVRRLFRRFQSALNA